MIAWQAAQPPWLVARSNIALPCAARLVSTSHGHFGGPISLIRSSSRLSPSKFAELLFRKLTNSPSLVGAKIANCVMLFAYERLRAFPIDVWIERVLRERYFPRQKKITAQRLREFSETYFGEHGGYAQQYLFHHARLNGTKNKTNSMNRAQPQVVSA